MAQQFFGKLFQTDICELKKIQTLNVTFKTTWYFFLFFMEKVPIGQSTNMVPYSTWYFSHWYFFLYTVCMRLISSRAKNILAGQEKFGLIGPWHQTFFSVKFEWFSKEEKNLFTFTVICNPL